MADISAIKLPNGTTYNLKDTTARNAANSAVPNTRTVNGKALSSNISLGAGDVGAYTKSETDTKINAAVASAYKYKGSVTADKLPTSGQIVGDVYNITNDSSYGKAGMNVAWNGTTWDALGSNVDLSNYVTTSDSRLSNARPASDVYAWAKAAKKPSYSASEISGLGSLATKNGLSAGDVGLGNVANLDQSKAIKSITRNGTTFTATALDGTTSTFTQQDNNTTYGLASQSSNGLMSSADKSKLDGIGAGSNVKSVNGKTGAVTLAKSDVGLSNVDNTADNAKSVKYAASAGNANTATGHSLGLNIPSPSADDQDKYLSAKGTWESITGKISGTKVTAADTADSIKAYTTRPASANNVFGDGKLRYFLATSSMTEGKPTAGDAAVLDLAWDNTTHGGWDAQIAIPTEGPLQIRSMETGTWQPWKSIAYKSDIPTSLPASDVYSWAKASSKPTYTASEVGAAPASHNHDDRYEIAYRSNFVSHDEYIRLGIATMRQQGDYLFIRVYSGSGYNGQITQDRAFDIHLRTSNGSGSLYAGYVEYHLNGSSNNDVYIVPNSSGTTYDIWIGLTSYSGNGFYIVEESNGAGWSNSQTTSNSIPSGAIKLTQKNIAYTSDIPTSLPANGGNAATVNGHTVNSDVPAGAVFTDHTYSAGDGLVLNGTEFKSRLNNRITIDLSDSKYDQNKWYPVVGTDLPDTGLVWLCVACQLNTEAAVTWSSHDSGTFTANLEILTKANGWGRTNSSTIVLDYSWGWTKDNVCPVSYCQMSHSSKPVFYLRGGGRYFVYASYDVKFTVYTSAYTAEDQTVDVQSSCPSIDFNNGTVYANLAGTVNGHTVNSDVPSGAKFTDTTYGAATQSSPGLMSAADKTKLDNLSSASTEEVKLTIPVSGWSSNTTAVNGTNYYTYSTTSITGISNPHPTIICSSASGVLPSAEERMAFDNIYFVTVDTSSSKITFYAPTKPKSTVVLILLKAHLLHQQT